MFRRLIQCRVLHAIRSSLLVLSLWAVAMGPAWAQPANDDCNAASPISVPGSGFGLGTVLSDSVDLTNATTQFNEFIPPDHVITNDKTVWFRFDLPVTREVRIDLSQPGVGTLNPDEAGWTLYRTGSCLPDIDDVVDPPIINIEGFTHRCLKPGSYLIQVSALGSANDSIALSLNFDYSSANETNYDFAGNPLDFGVISGSNLPNFMDQFYDVGCQSFFQGENLCGDSSKLQTTWHTFTTDGSVDLVRFEVGEDPWLGGGSNREWVVNLYEGNARMDSLADGVPAGGENLTLISGCQTLTQTSSSNYGATFEACVLDTNKTYSIQLLHPTDYSARINTRMFEVGDGTTTAPDPNNVPASNDFGLLPFGSTQNGSDVFSCESRMSLYAPCAPAIPSSGEHTFSGTTYELNDWYTFELPQAGDVNIRTNATFAPSVYVRIYQGDVRNGGCGSLSLFTDFRNDQLIKCLPAGEYSIQLLGKFNPDEAHQFDSHLGKDFNFSIEYEQVAPQSFDLDDPTRIDSVNGGNPIPQSTQITMAQDFFDCETTLLPAGDVCDNSHDRAIYRRIVVDTSGILTIGGGNWWRFRYRLYRGDASAEVGAGNVVGGRIQNLVDQAGCQRIRRPFKVCVTPGVYTLVSFGDVNDVTFGDQPWVRLDSFSPTQFTNPNAPEVLDTISVANPSSNGTQVRFTCADNPMDILGNTPCNGATKQVYREVFIDGDFNTTFDFSNSDFQNFDGTIRYRIFRGRLSQGSLTSMERNCGGDYGTCIDRGWYTIVTYADGQDFSSPEYTNGRGGAIGNTSNVTISIDTRTSKFDSLVRADSAYEVTPIDWEPNLSAGHTAAYPVNHKTVTLEEEFFDCSPDRPFENGVTACDPKYNRVSYRVFRITKPSYLHIDGLDPWPRDFMSKLYEGDLRTASPPFNTVVGCIENDIRVCNLSPGTYTLATFADDGDIGRTLSPRIYVDSVGTSKYDHANNAYDFGALPDDDSLYLGKPGEPFDALGRPPSNDFFFCTTGSQSSDPDDVCDNGQPPPPNSLPNPTFPRRNLWYTFVVDGPGRVHVSVFNETDGKHSRSPFAIYRSDDVGFTPGSQVDSTTADGLSFVTDNIGHWCSKSQTVNFFRDPCNFTQPTRYYILVDKNDDPNNRAEPNSQIEVGVRFEPDTAGTIQYDHYSQANIITGNPTSVCDAPFTRDTLSSGTFTGCPGDLSCATQDPTDQNSCGDKTIWYSFETDRSGAIRLNFTDDGGNTDFNNNDLMLFKQVVPGDSSSSGLVNIPLNSIFASNPNFDGGANHRWGEACMSPGRYFLMFTGCNNPQAVVTPRIWLLPDSGDLCKHPGFIQIDSAGTFTETLNINCHTIGEGPGEDGTNVGCLGTPAGKKSQWIRIDIPQDDTFNLDIELLENTNVTSDKVKYRVGQGSCGAMSFDNCVSEGSFIVLNLKCRGQGTYWIHSMEPEVATGSIEYRVTATEATDTTCEPPDPETPNALYNFSVSCFGDPVTFDNQSTTGDSINYEWTFPGGIVDSSFEPVFSFAQPDTFLVQLKACRFDTLCDSLTRQIIVPPVPGTFFTGPDTVLAGESFTLTEASTDTTSASVYQWNFCSHSGLCTMSPATVVSETPPPVTYNQAGTKTVCLTVFNGSCDSTFCRDVEVVMPDIFTGGPFDGHDSETINANCEQNIFTGGPFDGHDSETINANCEQNIFTGGPFDGHGSETINANCQQNIFAGGPFDGHGSETINANCEANIFAGGPFDGHAVIQVDSCPLPESIFSGGPFDGHSVVEDQQCTPPPNIFAGGPFDGHSEVVQMANCEPNIFTGGPFDGHGSETINATCEQNIFAGGPFDGHSEVVQMANCKQNIFTGGPFDGHDSETINATCKQNIFTGGPFDGHGSETINATCDQNIFAGGPFDGHSEVIQMANCEQNIFTGGPFDGHGSESINATCDQNIFTGGPFDGHGSQDIRPNCQQNVFAGGPFDGSSVSFVECQKPNIFAGGPYDGADEVSRPSAGAMGDTVCPGNPATLVAFSNADWYATPTGGTPLATNTSTFITPPLQHSRFYYIEAGCGSPKTAMSGDRIPVYAHVWGYLDPQFSASPACAGEITQFFNQTTVSGPTSQTMGPGNLIGAVGTTGIPPNPGEVSFSTACCGSPDLNDFANGINDGNDVWNGNNSGPSTEWVQWNYVNPKSVRRFSYMNQGSTPNRSPKQLRLYFDDGSGWQLVKFWEPPHPSGGSFNSGLILETNGLFARRWKLEVDVDASNAPTWGEFQVHAADPTVGGTPSWQFGDGGTSTAQNPTHVYSAPGTYDVIFDANAPGCCSDPDTASINICSNTPLPILTQLLTGEFVPEQEAIALDWQVEGTFDWAEFQKLVDGQWVRLDSFPFQAFNNYEHIDPNPNLNGRNIYRVRSETFSGAEAFSNRVEIRLGDQLTNLMRVFPNPLRSDELTLELESVEDGQAEVAVFNKLGQRVLPAKGLDVKRGRNTYRLDMKELAAGLYTIRVQLGGDRLAQQFIVIR